MPNYSSGWAMEVDGNDRTSTNSFGCPPVKTRNLLENLSPTPPPPPFQDFISLINTTKRTHTSLSIGNESRFSLPHQTPSPHLDHTNCQYAKIRARPLYKFNYAEGSIWTRTTVNELLLDANMMKKFFAKETTSLAHRTQRSRTISNSITRPFQILHPSFQMAYDVTMRHLLQLLTKTNGPHATIDDVLRGIDRGDIDPEWLQCVQRLHQMLEKQFLYHPEDRIKLETHPMTNLDQLNFVEQFFLKLFHLPHWNLKLKSYQYRDEYQSQIDFFRQSIARLLDGIDLILHDTNLPKIFQILCFLYNSLSNKSVPGLDLNSFVDALNSPTNQSKKTVAHVLTQILDQYHRETLFNVINNQNFIQLKSLLAMKYESFYMEIRQIYEEYQRLEDEYSNVEQLPAFIPMMLAEAKVQFEELFREEYRLKKGEENLAGYFCADDLSVDHCLATIGQFVDKLRLAHLENIRDGNQVFRLIDHPRKRSTSLQVNSFVPCHCL